MPLLSEAESLQGDDRPIPGLALRCNCRTSLATKASHASQNFTVLECAVQTSTLPFRCSFLVISACQRGVR
jgi:hypothetical protein